MQYKFNFRPYRRRFKPPLQTNHGIWDVRDGIILRLSNETSIGAGEIAPISWFGSETIEQALDFCRHLPGEITEETIFSIPDELPACQFGFESAWEAAARSPTSGVTSQKNSLSPPTSSASSASPALPHPNSLTYSGLLPAGKAALQRWQTLWNQGYRTFKWKIGVYPIALELEIFDLLTRALPALARMRLDANGGLSYDEASLWLYRCDRIRADHKIPVEIEFIEQPLSVDQFTQMLELSYCYATAIALDESVATIPQIEACYQQSWRGIFVIKPSIAGSPKRLRQLCQAYKIDTVFSSVFETSVGRQAALKLVVELSNNNRAVGFGVNHWFEQDEQTWLEQLWH